MSIDRISCIILAGGQARRMSSLDKGLLNYWGKLLIEHVIDAISPQLDDIVISANRNLEQYKALGYPVYTDGNHDFNGPLAGIISAVPHCRHDWILVLPCDMPSLPADLVSLMKSSAKEASLIVASTTEQRQLIFLFHRSLYDSIADYLSSHQYCVMHWIDSVNHEIALIDNENYLININAPEQLTI